MKGFPTIELLSAADKINTALLLVTALGVLAAFWQIRAGARASRATFLKDLYLQLRTDADVARAFYLIEYDEFIYDHNFHGSELEPKIDRLFTLIDLVCEMRSQGVISKREMNFFDYQFGRVDAKRRHTVVPCILEWLLRDKRHGAKTILSFSNILGCLVRINKACANS